jgi:murein DD-endopeptidase MepM/ murein hydrolase activator NlpD
MKTLEFAREIVRGGMGAAIAMTPLAIADIGLGASGAIAQTPGGCGTPALANVRPHRVAAGETLDQIAARYNLIPATVLGFNPSLRSGPPAPGTTLQIPPFNGIRVAVPSGQTWRDVAKQYGVRPDVLFEVNGCQRSPQIVFVPGVNWSPVGTATAQTPMVADRILSTYPLPLPPSPTAILVGFGWRLQSSAGQTVFHGGIDLAAPVGTAVLAAGAGTVAFVGNQGAYGNLVVLNHAEGLQTRYAQLGRMAVKVGQVVPQGATIATVGQSGRPSSREPHLHFEVRSRSQLGWVAENPEPYLLRGPSRRAGN